LNLKPDNDMPIPLGEDPAGAAPNSTGAEVSFDAVEASHLLDLFLEGQYDQGRMERFFAAHSDLRAEVFKRANSVVFYRSQPTTELHHAILRVGIFELYGIIFKALAKHQRD
jgi:hypothetical protein